MSLTDPQFIAWLKQGEKSFRCLLAESGCKSSGVELTRYYASVGYTADPTDTNANRKYVGVITDGGVTRETLPINGDAAFAVSDLVFINTNGELDGYVYDIWTGRPTRLYVGDMRWPTTDFRLVFDGINEGIKPGDGRRTFVLAFKDKLQRLNTAVSEHKLGGVSPNAERVYPWGLGEMHNVTPMLEDFSVLQYGWNDGAMERVIETRDNGVIITTTDTLASGYSRLSRRPFGLVTGSIQGAKFGGVYSNTVSKLVQALAMNFGQDPFVAGDLDAVNLAAFDAANQQVVGRYMPDTENVFGVMQEFAQSVGAQATTNALGKLQLLKVALPAAGTSTLVTDSRMVEGTLRIIDVPEVVAAVAINYCKNWTVQTTLDTGVPVAHKDMYAQEWYSTTQSDATVATDHKITKAPEPRNTLLQKKVDADALATSELALWGTQRLVMEYSGEPELMLEPLGGAQTLQTDRFELSAGKDAQILYVERDWLNTKVKFQVLV